MIGDTKFKVIDDLSSMVDLGVSANAMIQALEPIMDRRLGQLLDKFQHTPPELGPMLDLRAQISEVWRIRKEMQACRDKGQNALTTLQNIVQNIQSRDNGRPTEQQ